MKSIERMSNKRVGATLLIASTLVVLAGCAATPNTNSADAGPPEMTDMMMSDMLTQRTILRALFDEPTLSGENILVSCNNGDVTIFGDVDSSPMRALAERTVRDVSGVTNVRNNISVN